MAEDLCEAGRGIPPVTAYPIENGVVGQPFTVQHGTAVQALPGFADGAFIVQDAAAAATVSDFLAPRPGETILDCCAAPGGKTIQAALAVGPAGHVVALDNSEARLARLRDNLSRVHLSGRVETALCDATSPELAAMLHGRRFDAALIDAPCSNSGVMARKPDARWRWSMDETRRVAQVQRGILRNVATLDVGRIVYSTCSIDRAENEDVAIAFACECGWKISSGRTLLPGGGARYRFGRDGKFLPSAWHDGAFAALLVRAI